MTKSLMKTRAEHMSVHGREHFQLIVDVHLLLLSDDQVLLGRRSNTGYGDGAYEPPSGHLDDKETVVEAAVRVAAEAGIALDPSRVTLAHVMHDVSGAGRIAFFLTANSWAGPGAGAADGYSDLAWFPLDLLPANMMDRARVAIREVAAGARFSTYPCFCAPDRTNRDLIGREKNGVLARGDDPPGPPDAALRAARPVFRLSLPPGFQRLTKRCHLPRTRPSLGHFGLYPSSRRQMASDNDVHRRNLG